MRVGIVLYIFLIVLISPVIYAAEGFTLAVSCGAAAAKMTGYNDSINSANAYNSSLGINSKLKKLDTGLSPEITAGYDFTTPVGLIGVYLRNNFILLYDSGSSARWANSVIAQNINSDLSAIFTGIGTRISFASELLPALSGYASVDAGLCYYFWNYISEETYKADGENIYRIRKEWQTAVPGVNFEAGIDWWFGGTMGVSLRGGYRLASGKVMMKIININGWTGPAEGEDIADYSGLYANAGLIFRFEYQDDGKVKKVKGGQFPGIALWLYNEAQDLYDEGLYRQASQKIKEAEDTAPGNEQITALKEKIQAVLKIEINADSVKKLIKQADEYRDKKDYKKARMRYSEAYAMDGENKQAKFYMEDFASKAAENYASAMGLKSSGKYKEALAAARLAYDYGGAEDAWELKNSLQAQLKNKKEQDRLYNEGVEQYQKGNYRKAVELWSEVVSIDPDDKEAVFNLEKAEKKLASEAGDGKTGILAVLGEARNAFDIGNMDEALKKCEYVLRLDPGNTEAARMIADIKKTEEENKQELLNKR